MSIIVIKDVDLLFPIFDFNNQSLRRLLLYTSAAGRVSLDNSVPTVHALSNVNVEMHTGDSVGLYGHNGAGKSSFLRLLSQIYTPTRGTVVVNGMVRSILSVSDGLEPSLSGLDNIFRVGLMRGFSLEEIQRYQEDIIEFSGLSEFIHLPVRSYSTGMQVRLVFSVITAGSCDVLLLDEFFATGDEDFTNKSKRRLQNMIDRAHVLVLASHSKQLLLDYCSRFLYFDRGRVMEISRDELLKL